MRPRPTVLVLIAVILIGSCCLSGATAQGLFERFIPVDQVDADPGSDFALTTDHGPWLIMAATFSGPGAEEQARELVLELRRRYNLAAYIHRMVFEHQAGAPGRGIDRYGAPLRTRFRQDGQQRQWAALVGDFPAIDDQRAQQLLKRVKKLDVKTLSTSEGKESAQTMVDERRRQDAILARLGKFRKRGPMSKAFMVPNPLLPREFFVPRGVDDFVAKMNKGVKFSLLDCSGKYSVKVATFRGNSILQTSGTTDDSTERSGKRRKSKRESSLVVAAENAHLLTQKLRDHDWEAYEFHNRTESIVTIGSFDQAMRRLPDGRIVPTNEVQRVIQTFGAAYDTPVDPLTSVGEDRLNTDHRERAIQNFSAVFSNQHGQVATGLKPKHVTILSRSRQLVRTIPMDIHPTVLEVPRRAISTAYIR